MSKTDKNVKQHIHPITRFLIFYRTHYLVLQIIHILGISHLIKDFIKYIHSYEKLNLIFILF